MRSKLIPYLWYKLDYLLSIMVGVLFILRLPHGRPNHTLPGYFSTRAHLLTSGYYNLQDEKVPASYWAWSLGLRQLQGSSHITRMWSR